MVVFLSLHQLLQESELEVQCIAMRLRKISDRYISNAGALQWTMNSLGRADVKLRHTKGKITENTVYACALLSAHADTHGTKGKKGTISRMSDQANAA